jgi:chorismate synthase
MEILGGPLYAVAGAGESHGPAITTIVFGCPPGLLLRAADIQHYLDRRRPGSNKHGTPRREDDTVALLSGLYQPDIEQLTAGPELRVSAGDAQQVTTAYAAGYTTGEPIAALVLSTAKKSADYAQFTGATGEVRPGHTDLVKHYKSLRLRGCARRRPLQLSLHHQRCDRRLDCPAAAGRVALGWRSFSSIVQVGPLHAADRLADHLEALHQQHGGAIPPALLEELETQLLQAEIHTHDAEFARAAGQLIKQTRIEGDSLGAALEVVAVNVPALAGDPLYQSLKLRIMGSLGGLNAVQGVEVGAGFAVAGRRGSENNDPIRADGYQRNSHGGLIGGITTGAPLVFRVAFKPTSTIVKPQLSVRKNLEEIDFQLQKGRHDPCVGVRAGVTLESRLAIELLNAVLMHQAQQMDPAHFRLFGGRGRRSVIVTPGRAAARDEGDTRPRAKANWPIGWPGGCAVR